MPHFALTIDPDAGYGRGIVMNGAALTEPLDLIYGTVNQITIQFADASGQPVTILPNEFTRILVRIVRPDAVLAETAEGVSLTADAEWNMVIRIASIMLETPELLHQILDQRPGTPDEPDYEERETYCRATLEIIGYASFDAECFSRRFGIPVRIWNRAKLPLSAPPEPHTDYLTAAETMAAIREAFAGTLIADFGIGAVTPPAVHCFYHDTYGTVAYLDDENSLEFLGYQAAGWHRLQLWLVSADPQISGNIVLRIGSARVAAPVSNILEMTELVFPLPLTGNLTLERDADDPRDTLRDAGDNIVTALAVDWRVW